MPRKQKELIAQYGKSIPEILSEAFSEHKTQAAVAKALGVRQSTISYWLLKYNLTQETVIRPAQVRQ
jgi:plasmid maintenance system antidote protein VapI